MHTSENSLDQRLIAAFRSDWPLWLTVLAVALQPVGRSVELPVLIMAVLGFVDLVKNRNGLVQHRSFKIFTLLFLCFWIPSLLSLLDAFNVSKSTATSLGLLRFYLSGVFVLSRLSSGVSVKNLSCALAVVAVFWGADGVFQLLTGTDIFGRGMFGDRVTGIFGDKPRTGWMLVPLVMVAVTYFWHLNRLLAIVSGFLIIGTIVASGDRGSWVGLFWATFILAGLYVGAGLRVSRKTVLLGGGVLVLIAAVMLQIPQVQNRISQTTIALKGDYASLDQATSGRMTLWSTALPLIEDNWINGVGARGFRYAYPKYAPPNDMFLHGEGSDVQGASHAHQIVLEVLAETGVIGLAGYLLALVILGTLVKRSCLRKNYLGMAFVATSLAVLFPLNSHLSIYASYWAQAIWILFAITVASVFSEAETVDGP